MSQKLITLQVSDQLYERVREVAEASDRSAEEVLVESLNFALQISPDLPPLEALSDYPTVQLWSIVLSRMPDVQWQRLHDLSQKNKWEELTEAEEAELDQLVDLNDKYMLLRSQALVLLQERGEDIRLYLNAGA